MDEQDDNLPTPAEVSILAGIIGDLHIGSSGEGHEVEDACPCPQSPCGLVAVSTIDPSCAEHGAGSARVILQIHGAMACVPEYVRNPPPPPPPEVQVVIPIG